LFPGLEVGQTQGGHQLLLFTLSLVHVSAMIFWFLPMSERCFVRANGLRIIFGGIRSERLTQVNAFVFVNIGQDLFRVRQGCNYFLIVKLYAHVP
jgi:hypothetical protein